MAATVSAWSSKPGAWALDAEEHEAEVLRQSKEENQQTNGGSDNMDFPSLSAATATKTKKKKGQTLSLQEFASYGSAKQAQPTQTKGLSAEELLMLPTGPRQRTAEELDRSKLGGGFRSYGSYDKNNREDSSNSRWGSSSRVSDEPRRQGRFDRDSTREIMPSRADEIDDWGAGKKSTPGGGFERRERGGFFSDSQSRADESDNWVSNKSFVPSEGRRFGSSGGPFDSLRERRGGFESNGGGADSDTWGKKDEEGRRFGTSGGAFDSLRGRRGGFEPGTNGGITADSETWGKKREEGGGTARPRLNLQPRTLPVDENQQIGSVAKPKASNPFGDARPREDVLKEKGQDWKEIDEKLESMKVKETVPSDGPMFGKRNFGSPSGRATLTTERDERSWRKPESADVSPPSSHKSENGLAEDDGKVEGEDEVQV